MVPVAGLMPVRDRCGSGMNWTTEFTVGGLLSPATVIQTLRANTPPTVEYTCAVTVPLTATAFQVAAPDSEISGPPLT